MPSRTNGPARQVMETIGQFGKIGIHRDADWFLPVYSNPELTRMAVLSPCRASDAVILVLGTCNGRALPGNLPGPYPTSGWL